MAHPHPYSQNGISPHNVLQQQQQSSSDFEPDGRQLRTQPFSLEEALPYTPFTSVFPFDSGKRCSCLLAELFPLSPSLVAFPIAPDLQSHLPSLFLLVLVLALSLSLSHTESPSSCSILRTANYTWCSVKTDFHPRIKTFSAIPRSAQDPLRHLSPTLSQGMTTMS
jgi:hypothetical protein